MTTSSTVETPAVKRFTVSVVRFLREPDACWAVGTGKTKAHPLISAASARVGAMLAHARTKCRMLRKDLGACPTCFIGPSLTSFSPARLRCQRSIPDYAWIVSTCPSLQKTLGRDLFLQADKSRGDRPVIAWPAGRIRGGVRHAWSGRVAGRPEYPRWL